MTPGVCYRGIFIGERFDDVITTLGAPVEKYPTKNNFDPEIDDSFYWRYPDKGLEIEFSYRGEVLAIHAEKGLEFSCAANAEAKFGQADEDGWYTLNNKRKRWLFWDIGIQLTTNEEGLVESVCICHKRY